MSGVEIYVIAPRIFNWKSKSCHIRRAMAGAARLWREKSTFLRRSRLGAAQLGGGLPGREGGV